MIQKINIVLIIATIIAFTSVYALKFSIEHTAGEKLALDAHIDSQEAELSLLKADWAFLTQPGHIEPIVRRHQEVLALAQVTSEQFGSFSQLAMRPAEPDDVALDELFMMLDAGIDPIGAILEGIE